MPKYIAVPVSFNVYEIQDDVFQILSNGTLSLPPHVVLELMALNGQAKRMGTIATLSGPEGQAPSDDDDDDEDDGEDDDTLPPDGAGPWLTE